MKNHLLGRVQVINNILPQPFQAPGQLAMDVWNVVEPEGDNNQSQETDEIFSYSVGSFSHGGIILLSAVQSKKRKMRGL